jgi:DNA-directed RNA polymerase
MSDWDQAHDEPELHPMWETQLELERAMMASGAKKLQDISIKANSREQMTRSPVVRKVLNDWLPALGDAVRKWLRDTAKAKGGPKPIAYQYLLKIDPDVSALVTLRTVLDGIGKESQKFVRLAEEIGRTIEHEQQVRLWESSKTTLLPAREGQDEQGSLSDLFYHYKDEMDRNRATDVHRRRVNINRFTNLVEDGLIEWSPWSGEVRYRVGAALIDALIRNTGWFELRPDPYHVFKRGSPNSPQLVVAPKEAFREWLGKATDRVEANSPDYGPTVMPPRRWDGTRDGGYWTPYANPPRLIRFKANQETQREYAADEYDAIDMPLVYDGIHLLQETSWRVNERVLEVAKKAWAIDEAIAKLPLISDMPLPPKTPAMMEDAAKAKEARREKRVHVRSPEVDAEVLDWKKRASPIYRFNNKRWSRMRSASATIQTAEAYAQYERFYFPHMLDFRGRMYPIPAYLQPQGNDLARGLLTFADGLPITEENGGAGWLAVHLAACWGKDAKTGVDIDKLGYEDRIAWVEENETMWRLIAEDPMSNMDWAKADKPWQTLAACFEWVDYLNTGWGFVSSLPVMVDGTCNGIQHLSAILRDEVAGRYVNLIPSDRPQDIYKKVATVLQEVLEEIERDGGPESHKASYWLDLCGRNLPRGLTKRQVMVLPYGGSKDSFFNYTREWLDEHDPVPADGGDEGYRQRRNERLSFLVRHMWDVVNRVVSSGLKVMKWLQDTAAVLCDIHQPIWWQTPSGMVVRHFYGISQMIRVDTMIDGERVQITRAERTAKLSKKEQLQGIAPNFIHSLDASALVLTLKRCREAGIEDFVSVHDAYGTHAANMNALTQFLREAFVEVHQHDVLGEFRAACQRVLVDALVTEKGMDPLEASEKADEMLPPPLEIGNLDISDVLLSDYFFA